MTHDELVIIAERWLLNSKGGGCGVVFRELTAYTDTGEIPDALGFSSWYSVLVECKVSRSDFLSDRKKHFRKIPENGMGVFRYYMCTAGLIAPEELPSKWGLIYVGEKGKAKVIVDALGPNGWRSRSPNIHEHNHKAERSMMYSALRRLTLRGRISEIYDQPWKQPAPTDQEKE